MSQIQTHVSKYVYLGTTVLGSYKNTDNDDIVKI